MVRDLSQEELEEILKLLSDKDSESNKDSRSVKGLEKFVCQVIKNIGLECFTTPSENVRMGNVHPKYVDLSSSDIELDCLIPVDDVCLLGEITSRNVNSKKQIKEKYKTLGDKIITLNDTFTQASREEKRTILKSLGISEENLQSFVSVEKLQLFFLFTKINENEISSLNKKSIKCFYRSDFLRLFEYSQVIGKWARSYFLSLFEIKDNSRKKIVISKNKGELICIPGRRVASDVNTYANMYLFEISPYELLNIANVQRQDQLSIHKQKNNDSKFCLYQRVLKSTKIKDIRKKLESTEDFTFPSNILVTLSESCEERSINGDKVLEIPQEYGSISVVDGQHRLFSYADKDIEKCQKGAKILVLALQFEISSCEDKTSELDRCNAKVFLEVNTTQDPVPSEFTQDVSHQIGSNDPKDLALGIIKELNTRNYKGYFKGRKKDSSLFGNTDGKVDYRPIQDAITPLVKKLQDVQDEQKEGRNSKLKKRDEGCRQLVLNKENKDLCECTTISIEEFLGKMQSKFKDCDNFLTFFSKYGNHWAGLIRLFSDFIDSGLDWESVDECIAEIYENIQNPECQDCKIPGGSDSPTKQLKQWKHCFKIEESKQA